MLKSCGLVVDWVGISFAKAGRLCALTTTRRKYLTSQVFFVRSLSTAFTQPGGFKSHPQTCLFNLLIPNLYTLATSPNNTNELNKGITI